MSVPNRHHDHDADYGAHPSVCTISRYPEDDELRAAGLTVHARPPYPAETVWRTARGAHLTHGAALAMVRRARAALEGSSWAR